MVKFMKHHWDFVPKYFLVYKINLIAAISFSCLYINFRCTLDEFIYIGDVSAVDFVYTNTIKNAPNKK